MKITQSTFKRSKGLSLIEMMVSMVIGLFLVGGLSTMYLNSKKTDKVRSAISDIEENARLTLNTLRKAIEHAGYKTVDNINLDKPFQTDDDGTISNQFCRDGQSMITNEDLITPPTDFEGYTKDGDLTVNESDRITVMFGADNPDRGPIFQDCAGGDYSLEGSDPVDDNARQVACSTDINIGLNSNGQARIYNGLYIREADKTLRCFGSRSPTGSQMLAENIVNMQIRYGVMKIDNAENKTTTYKNATQIDTANEWEAVTSVQIAILVGSEKEVLEQAQSHEYDLLDETITIDADRRLYRTFSTTIYLPNRSRREMQKVTRGSAEAT